MGGQSVVSFTLMSLALLLTPGPTNTLLFVGGATNGLKRSLGLPLAELLGYLAAIHILALSIWPFVQQMPQRNSCCGSVCRSIWRSWR